MEQDMIINGPYLLAPTATAITVTWETRLPMKAKIWYGVNDCLDNKLTVQCERGTAWKDNPEGICMYRAVLKDLEPNTVYGYKVELASGEMQQGSFKTLSDNPEEIRIFTVSDSHLFKTNQEFMATVLSDKPDFIIHSGDISLGTGYQKDQYTNNWFQRGAGFLSHIPTIYTAGNHDAGSFYDEFFFKAQNNTYNTDTTGHNVSFNYGNTHILLVDSNPWGLFEMNAVNSGLAVDDDTRNKIDSTLTWLIADLKSAAAQTAVWRILVLHHPYTDDFTNKHIVSIAEKYNVNLVIAGHLHYYIKSVSVNPKIGANTVYISQGSAEDYGANIDYGTADERILVDFPEVVAKGEANYGYIAIKGEELSFKTFGFEKGVASAKLVDEVKLVKAEPNITVADIAIQAQDNGNVTIAGSAKNAGHGLAALAIKINDNDNEFMQNLFGDNGKERVIVLNSGEEKRFKATYKITEPGSHIIKVCNVVQKVDITVNEPVKLENMKVKVGEGNAASVVFAAVEVTNNQAAKSLAKVDLYIDDQVVNCKYVKLKPYEKQVIDFAHQFHKGGTYKVRIGNLSFKEVTIEGTLKGIPIIKDLSGNGNNGLLRGTPKLKNDENCVTVSLDNYQDYIEIPDSEHLHVKDGYTGIVWAKVNRLATADEMAHNPLMVKGISLGWGATYLLRMAVERSGGLKWGTCHGITEYSWQGGKTALGAWTQYTSTFDKQTGGASYCNTQKVAEIAGIKAEAVLNNWEGLPLFVGYSYIGHVIKEIGRPKYFTHLPAQISQVRFYKTQLSQEEVNYIHNHPDELGPNSNDLAVWLNFQDIEVTGCHKTEWRRPAEFYPAYKADKKLWEFKTLSAEANIPGTARLKAIVQVSDDGETIKDYQEFILQSGKQTINIANLQEAQYIRIITEFNSVITNEGTYTPELMQYTIMAKSEKIVTHISWGTRVDWEKGSIEGAIGFTPVDRLKVFDEYTDVIHG